MVGTWSETPRPYQVERLTTVPWELFSFLAADTALINVFHQSSLSPCASLVWWRRRLLLVEDECFTT